MEETTWQAEQNTHKKQEKLQKENAGISEFLKMWILLSDHSP